MDRLSLNGHVYIHNQVSSVKHFWEKLLNRAQCVLVCLRPVDPAVPRVNGGTFSPNKITATNSTPPILESFWGDFLALKLFNGTIVLETTVSILFNETIPVHDFLLLNFRVLFQSPNLPIRTTLKVCVFGSILSSSLSF